METILEIICFFIFAGLAFGWITHIIWKENQIDRRPASRTLPILRTARGLRWRRRILLAPRSLSQRRAGQLRRQFVR